MLDFGGKTNVCLCKAYAYVKSCGVIDPQVKQSAQGSGLSTSLGTSAEQSTILNSMILVAIANGCSICA